MSFGFCLALVVLLIGSGFAQVGQNSGYYVSPNATYDKFVGIQSSRCSRCDLIMALSGALHKRGIKIIVYVTSGAANSDRVAIKALQWRNVPYPNREFQIKWQQVIQEWSERWGRNLDCWWFGGCYFPTSMYRSKEPPNFESFAVDGRVDSKQVQVLSYLGSEWGSGNPRFSTEDLVKYTQNVWNSSGAVAWDVPVQLNGTIYPAFREQLAAVGKAARER